MAKRYFSLDEAQALVPRVREMMGRALQLHGHLRAAIARLDATGTEVSWPVLRGEEALEDSDEFTEGLLRRARGLYFALRETISETEAIGVEVKGVVDGLVDFRSWRDGHEEVLLCWKLGEDEIEWFHGVDDGFAGRRPIAGHRFTAERERPDQALPTDPS
ncbi:DUF2203 domain-containing protein [Pseudenhygromyxa sp. WMMC2535]|uniref:DUF2203 family protein n=1 Tax=Pseudenhygromyxa sp. WMMC2535 TaxID=2712867 RepID=UPI001555D013|nr:DUF2203 domain-containing protein [Pseudenhygromyxa sp. WMMC2535]